MCKLIVFDCQLHLNKLKEQYQQLVELLNSYQQIVDDFELQKNEKIGYLVRELNLLENQPNYVAKKPKQQDEVTKLFKELSKRIHPDTTQNVELKSTYLKLFQQLNNAKQNSDLELILKIKLYIDNGSGEFLSIEDQSINSQIKNLEIKIIDLKLEISNIEKSKEFKLILAHNYDYNNYFSQLEKELKYKIDYLKNRRKSWK